MEIKEYILFAKKLSVLILTIGILLAASSARAANNGVGETFIVGSLEYTITVAAGAENGEVTLSDGASATGAVTIPKTVTDNGNGYNVTAVGDKAFEMNMNITALTFEGASDGTSALESIGESAFWHTENLTVDITIPASVKTIEMGAFFSSGITGLTFAGANGGTSVLESIGYSAFESCGDLTGDIGIPASVKTIGEGAFQNSNITGLTFAIGTDGTSVLESIGGTAFRDCALLTGDITIPPSVKTIKQHAFADSGITGVVIPGSVNEIESNAFADTVLGEVVFKGAAPTFGTDVFKDVTGTLVIKVPTQYLDSYKAAFPGYAGSIVGAEPDVYTAAISKAEFEKGKATAIEITSSAPAQLFMGVEVNGAALAAENYTVKQGSTIITLSQVYLNGLDVGDYNVKLLFDYGSAEASFKVKAAATTESTTTEQTTESTQSTQSTESTQSTKPTEPTKPTDTTKPGTDTTKPSGQPTTPTPSASTAATAEGEDISPKTGDYSRLRIMIGVMAVAGGMLTFLFKVKGKVN